MILLQYNDERMFFTPALIFQSSCSCFLLFCTAVVDALMLHRRRVARRETFLKITAIQCTSFSDFPTKFRLKNGSFHTSHHMSWHQFASWHCRQCHTGTTLITHVNTTPKHSSWGMDGTFLLLAYWSWFTTVLGRGVLVRTPNTCTMIGYWLWHRCGDSTSWRLLKTHLLKTLRCQELKSIYR